MAKYIKRKKPTRKKMKKKEYSKRFRKCVVSDTTKFFLTKQTDKLCKQLIENQKNPQN